MSQWSNLESDGDIFTQFIGKNNFALRVFQMTAVMTETRSSLKLEQRRVEASAELTGSSTDCCGRSSVIAARDQSLCSLPGAFLACSECGAKGSLGFRRLTIWNGALFNVAYAETSWLRDSTHFPPPRCSHSLTHVWCFLVYVRSVTNFCWGGEFELGLLWLSQSFAQFWEFEAGLWTFWEKETYTRGSEEISDFAVLEMNRVRNLKCLHIQDFCILPRPSDHSSPLPSVFAFSGEPYLLSSEKNNTAVSSHW